MRSQPSWTPDRDTLRPLADSNLHIGDLREGDRLIFVTMHGKEQVPVTNEWQIIKQEDGVFILRRPSDLAIPLVLNHSISRQNFLSIWNPDLKQIAVPQAIFEEMLRGGVYPFETLVEGELRGATEPVYPCHVVRNNPGDSGPIDPIRNAVKTQLPKDVH